MDAFVEKDSGHKELDSLLNIPESGYKRLVPELIRVNQNEGPVNYLLLLF